MRKIFFPYRRQPHHEEPLPFTHEEQQFLRQLTKLTESVKPERGFVLHLEAKINAAGPSGNGNQPMFQEPYKRLHRRSRLNTAAAFGLVLLAVTIASILMVPSLQTTAREALNYWRKTEDIQSVPAPTISAPLAPEVVPAIVDEVEQGMKSTQQTLSPLQEDFVIKLPSRLPEGYQLNRVEIGQWGNAWVDLSDWDHGNMLTLQIQPSHQVEGTLLGPADKVVRMEFGGLMAEYVRGGWALNHSISGQMKPAQAEKLTWIDDSSYRKLRWNDGNLNYYLVSTGDRNPGDPGYLGMNDLAQIAESMQPANLSAGPFPTPEAFTADLGVGETTVGDIIDIRQLEALAGFGIPTASVIPENYQFAGGRVETIAPAMRLMYTCEADSEAYPNGSFAYSLQIRKVSEDRLLWEKEQFGQSNVGESAVIESVVINGVTAEYVSGNWKFIGSGMQPEKKQWDNNVHWHKLQWYLDGFLYTVETAELMVTDYEGPCKLTKQDFVTFAESLK
jgi:hypothetical protein